MSTNIKAIKPKTAFELMYCSVRESLARWSAGVTGVSGSFRPEEAVEIAGPDEAVFAKGLVRVHAERAAEWMGRRSQVVVHRDDLVLVS